MEVAPMGPGLKVWRDRWADYCDWPYTHFTMVHATSTEGCEEIEREISEATGITERLLLYSSREYKKTRVRYFVPEYDQYQDAVNSAPAPLAQRG